MEEKIRVPYQDLADMALTLIAHRLMAEHKGDGEKEFVTFNMDVFVRKDVVDSVNHAINIMAKGMPPDKVEQFRNTLCGRFFTEGMVKTIDGLYQRNQEKKGEK